MGIHTQHHHQSDRMDWEKLQQDYLELEEKFNFVTKFKEMNPGFYPVDPEVLLLYPQFDDKLYQLCDTDMSFKKSVQCECTLIATFCTLVRRVKSAFDEIDEDTLDPIRCLPDQLHGLTDQITNKNRNLSEHLDKIKGLQVSNDKLQEYLDQDMNECKQVTEEIKSRTDDYKAVKTNLQKTDEFHEMMRKERNNLRSQFQDLQSQVQMMSESEISLIVSGLNGKLNEYEGLFHEFNDDEFDKDIDG